MAIVVIGGQASGVGKTGVVCALITAMPERRWTAIKITQCSHHAAAEGESRAGVSALTHTEHDVAGTKACDCKLDGHTFAFSEEREATDATDSSRYLAAGAARSVWGRVQRGHLAEAMPRIHDEIVRAENVVLESNSIIEFLSPDLYVLVLSPGGADFKLSALRYLDRADAILLTARLTADVTAWTRAVGGRVERVPHFEIAPEGYVSRECLAWVAQRLERTAAQESAAPRKTAAREVIERW